MLHLQYSKGASGVRIWSANGLCKLALAANLFTVPPTPSHGDFPWFVTKKAPGSCHVEVRFVET